MFYEYMDGLLSKADEARLLEHLETCSQCKKDFAFAQSVEQQLQLLPLAPLPEDFDVKLREKLVKLTSEKPAEKKKDLLKFLPRYGLAVSAAAAFAIMLLAYNSNLKPADYPSGSDVNLPAATTSAPEETERVGQPDVQIQQEKGSTEKGFQDDPSEAESKTENTQGTTAPSKSPAPKPSGSASQKTNSTYRSKAPAKTAAPESAMKDAPSVISGNDSESMPAMAGGGSSGGGSSPMLQSNANAMSARSAQGLIFVIHSTVDSQTLKQLYALPTFQVVGGNRYQMQRSYQNDLIKVLKNLDYSIHFSSETSRVDKDAVIIELI